MAQEKKQIVPVGDGTRHFEIKRTRGGNYVVKVVQTMPSPEEAPKEETLPKQLDRKSWSQKPALPDIRDWAGGKSWYDFLFPSLAVRDALAELP